ncbi:MAG: hypothetical protein IJ905_06695 [Fibrobacter sp.]|nr:hypothetical protein [Fibrobacter sp.]
MMNVLTVILNFMNEYMNVIFAICYAVSAIAAVIMIKVTVSNYRDSVKMNQTSIDLERYFKHVVLYAMQMAENSKEKLIAIIQEKQQKIKSGTSTTGDIQKYNDQIQASFLNYKRNISSRLRIFDVSGEEIDKYWEEMDNNLTTIIGQIDPQKQLTEISAVCELFDKSVMFVKNVKSSKNCK